MSGRVSLTPQYAFSFTSYFATCVQLLYDIFYLKILKAICQEIQTRSNLNFICLGVIMQTQRQGYLDDCQLWKSLNNNYFLVLPSVVLYLFTYIVSFIYEHLFEHPADSSMQELLYQG